MINLIMIPITMWKNMVSKVRDEGVEWVLPMHDHQPSILQWPSNGFKTLIGSLTLSIMTFKESHNLFSKILNPCSLIILLYMVKVNCSMCRALFYIQNMTLILNIDLSRWRIRFSVGRKEMVQTLWTKWD
jgi:hypothetical protein